MSVTVPRPLAEDADTVTLRRSEWEALVDQLEEVEDFAAIAARREYEAAIGKDAARRSYLTADEVRRLARSESPVKVWREKRRLSQRDLANRAAVSPSYLAEIETCRKPGSAAALLRLARVLEVNLEDLLPAE
jgi:ribosome-binding protein aMBF1 (putative translation factor)